MMPKPRMFACAAAFVLVALFATAGCLPAVWLPDSSGFVFTRGTNFTRLDYCGVPQGESRKIALVTAHTAWPAVSSDGKRIALARIAPAADKRGMTCEVILHDLEGKVVDRSEAFAWRAGRPVERGGPAPSGSEPATDVQTFDESRNGEVPLAAVFWDKPSGKLLIEELMPMTADAFDGRLGVYDPAAKTLRSFVGNACAVGGTPFRPDGKGFLITRGHPARGNFTVLGVDWDGAEHAVEMPATAKSVEDLARIIRSPWIGSSEWQGAKPVATITHGRQRVTIDVANLKGLLEELPADPTLPSGRVVVQTFSFGEKGTKVRVVEGDLRAIEMVLPGASEWKTVAHINDPVLLSPSPNGKWLLIRMATDAMEETRDPNVILVSELGEVKHITETAP